MWEACVLGAPRTSRARDVCRDGRKRSHKVNKKQTFSWASSFPRSPCSSGSVPQIERYASVRVFACQSRDFGAARAATATADDGIDKVARAAQLKRDVDLHRSREWPSERVETRRDETETTDCNFGPVDFERAFRSLLCLYRFAPINARELFRRATATASCAASSPSMQIELQSCKQRAAKSSLHLPICCRSLGHFHTPRPEGIVRRPGCERTKELTKQLTTIARRHTKETSGRHNGAEESERRLFGFGPRPAQNAATRRSPAGHSRAAPVHPRPKARDQSSGGHLLSATRGTNSVCAPGSEQGWRLLIARLQHRTHSVVPVRPRSSTQHFPPAAAQPNSSGGQRLPGALGVRVQNMNLNL